MRALGGTPYVPPCALGYPCRLHPEGHLKKISTVPVNPCTRCFVPRPCCLAPGLLCPRRPSNVLLAGDRAGWRVGGGRGGPLMSHGLVHASLYSKHDHMKALSVVVLVSSLGTASFARFGRCTHCRPPFLQ